MSIRFGVFLILCLLMAFCGSVAHAADPQARLAVYQNEVCGKPSGVYEIDGYLYAHVRLPKGRNSDTNRLKLKASSSLNGLLKNWAVERTRSERECAQDNLSSTGIAKVAEILEDALPGWWYAGWSVKYTGQAVSGVDKTDAWFGQIIPIEEFEKQIPASFRAGYTAEQSLSALREMMPMMLSKDSRRVYAMCGAADLDADIDIGEIERKELAETISLVDNYLESDKRVARFRSKAERIRLKSCTEHLESEQCPDVLVTNVITTVQTNLNDCAKVATNSFACAQTDEDVVNRGVSRGRMLSVEERVSAPEEEVVTEVVTITRTRRTKHIKRVMEEWGDSLFYDIFLSGGTFQNRVAERCASGNEAVSSYFSSKSLLEERERRLELALEENPGDVELWTLYGRCLLAEGEACGALICFRAAAKLDPGNQFVLTNLAVAYDALGKRKVATGIAVIAYGISIDKWCVKTAESVLRK